MCVSTVYTQYFLSPRKKISQVYHSGGILNNDPCNFRAVSYQLDYRDCPVARGSSNLVFWQQYKLLVETGRCIGLEFNYCICPHCMEDVETEMHILYVLV